MFFNLFFSDRPQQPAAVGPPPSGPVASHHAFPPHKQQSDRELLSRDRDRRAGGAVNYVNSSSIATMHHPSRLYIPLQVRAPLATLSPSTTPNASSPTKVSGAGGAIAGHGAHAQQQAYQQHNHHTFQQTSSQTGAGAQAPAPAFPAFRRGSFLYRATDSDSEEGSEAPPGWPGGHSRKRSSGSVALLGGLSRGSLAVDGYAILCYALSNYYTVQCPLLRFSKAIIPPRRIPRAGAVVLLCCVLLNLTRRLFWLHKT